MSQRGTKVPRPKAAGPPRSPTLPAVAKRDSDESKRQLEKAAVDQRPRRFLLKLYVTGTTPASVRAIQRVRSVCEEHLQGRYDLEVVDIYQKPSLAKDEQIIATPTLIKVLPAPLRRFIGDLTKAEKVLFGLDLRELT
ncbi:MAG TPA: circadian clock KaiB family protein [Myxococcales bacterium]|jgi:circadian clock protein KaiB